MKYVDLSLPIQPHWRYPFVRHLTSSFAAGDSWQVTEFSLRSHWFSHIDFPRHTGASFPDSDDFGLELYNGAASVVDVSRVSAAEYGIRPEDLERARRGRTLENILLIRSDWGLTTRWESRDFWEKAPFLTEESIDWIAAMEPTAVAFDFPQDFSIRLLAQRPVPPSEQSTHVKLLRRGILLIEYLTNFYEIGRETCEFICLPLRIPRIDGCPVRAVAKV